MKVAITSKGTLLESEIDPRFGRARFILIVDSETLEFEVMDNSINANAFKGAGIQAATMISDKGAEVLVTGYCGPKAFCTLETAGIKVIDDITGKVWDAIKTIKDNKVAYATGANKDAHW